MSATQGINNHLQGHPASPHSKTAPPPPPAWPRTSTSSATPTSPWRASQASVGAGPISSGTVSQESVRLVFDQKYKLSSSSFSTMWTVLTSPMTPQPPPYYWRRWKRPSRGWMLQKVIWCALAWNIKTFIYEGDLTWSDLKYLKKNFHDQLDFQDVTCYMFCSLSQAQVPLWGCNNLFERGTGVKAFKLGICLQ